MKIAKLYLFLFVAILFIQPITGHSQTFKVFKGDTINRTDAKGLKQGVWKKYYENDQLFSSTFYKDGKASGTTTTFYRSGEKQSEMLHQKDGKTSYMTMFWPNGKKKAVGKYIDQKKDSTWKFYSDARLLNCH